MLIYKTAGLYKMNTVLMYEMSQDESSRAWNGQVLSVSEPEKETSTRYDL